MLLVQVKVQDLEAQVLELRARTQQLDLERSRQAAELDVLRRLVTRHSHAPADAAAARVAQLEAYVCQLETSRRALAAERDAKWSPPATVDAAAVSGPTRVMQLEAQVGELTARLQATAAEREAAARVPQLEAHIEQLQARLEAERQVSGQVPQLQATVQQLQEHIHRLEMDRAKDRAQLDAFHANQLAAAEESQSTVRLLCAAHERKANTVLMMCMKDARPSSCLLPSCKRS